MLLRGNTTKRAEKWPIIGWWWHHPRRFGYSYRQEKIKNKPKAEQETAQPTFNKLAKFQLPVNWFRGCWLGVNNVRSTFRNFHSKKTRKIHFLRHLTHNKIITPNHPFWCLPERDHLAITVGVWQVICRRPNLYTGRVGNTLYFLVGYKSLLSEVS